MRSAGKTAQKTIAVPLLIALLAALLAALSAGLPSAPAAHAVSPDAASESPSSPAVAAGAAQPALDSPSAGAPAATQAQTPAAQNGKGQEVRLGNKALVGSILAAAVIIGSIAYGLLTRPKGY